MVFRIFFVLTLLTYTTYSYDILVIFPTAGKSHGILGEGVVRHLANAGHKVTYVAAFLPSKPIPNVTIVDISNDEWLQSVEKVADLKAFVNNEMTALKMLSTFSEMLNYTAMTLDHPNMRQLLYDDTKHFDLVIAEWMFTDTYAGFSAVFDCPYIWFSSVEPHWAILRLIDEVPNPSYHTDIQSSSIPPFTFGQRAMELGVLIFGHLMKYFLMDGVDINDYNTYIAPAIINKGRSAPSFEELKYNASMVLGNSHVALGIPTRVPENYKHIGGFHVQETVKPLPEDLKKIMDNAKHGVIYFSMGSNLKSKTLPTELKQNLLKMFSTLKQTVLWKFEEDLPNRPENVHIVKWAPQQSILAHPNVVLFITHGGHLSTTESIYYGVPIIGIPVFGDQFVNVGRAIKKGFARRVDLSFDMVDELKEAIDDMLVNDRYRTKVKELSAIYHDRTVSPGKELVHWVEHVIKTNGALHMRSPALLVPWYQKCYLDLLLVITIMWYCTKLSLRWLNNILRTKGNVKKKTS